MAPPGALKWVPVSRDAGADAGGPAKPEKAAAKPPERAEPNESKGKGKHGSSGTSAKGASKGDKGARKGEKSESKWASGGDTRGGGPKAPSGKNDWGGNDWGNGGWGQSDWGTDDWGRSDWGKGDGSKGGKGSGPRPPPPPPQQQPRGGDIPGRSAGGKGGGKGEKHDGGKASGKAGGGKAASGKAGGGKPAGGKGGGGKFGGKESGGAVKTVQEVEAEMAKTQAGKGGAAPPRTKRGPDSYTKQPIDAKGSHCEVHKHSGMGCAVVSLESFAAREAIMVHAERKFGGTRDEPPKMDISDVTIQIRRHTDKATKREVVTDLFIAWGHKQEKENPLACEDIAEAFDELFTQAQSAAAMAGPTNLTGQDGYVPRAYNNYCGGAGARQPPGGGPPPPPSHMPTVRAPVAAGVPGSAQHGYYDAYQRQGYPPNPCGGYNQQQPRYGGHAPQQQPCNPYQQQQQQQQQAYQHQQAAAAAMQHQQQLRHLQHMQHLQYLQQQQQLQASAAAPQQQPQQPPTPSQQLQQAVPQQPPTPQGMQPGSPMAAAAGAAAPCSPGVPGPAPLGAVDAGMVAAAPVSPSSDYALAKPKIVPIVDPATGKSIDTIGMNFEPRKPGHTSRLAIKDPLTGQAVTP